MLDNEIYEAYVVITPKPTYRTCSHAAKNTKIAYSHSQTTFCAMEIVFPKTQFRHFAQLLNCLTFQKPHAIPGEISIGLISIFMHFE